MIETVDRLTNELLDADGGEGAEIKKRENVHRCRKRIRRSRITGEELHRSFAAKNAAQDDKSFG